MTQQTRTSNQNTNNMTTLQIKKALLNTGFSLKGIEISNNKLEINVSSDYKKNSRMLSKICKANNLVGYGFMTGYGSFIFHINGSRNPFVTYNID